MTTKAVPTDICLSERQNAEEAPKQEEVLAKLHQAHDFTVVGHVGGGRDSGRTSTLLNGP